MVHRSARLDMVTSLLFFKGLSAPVYTVYAVYAVYAVYTVYSSLFLPAGRRWVL
jgi:hypothetical protein